MNLNMIFGDLSFLVFIKIMVFLNLNGIGSLYVTLAQCLRSSGKSREAMTQEIFDSREGRERQRHMLLEQ